MTEDQEHLRQALRAIPWFAELAAEHFDQLLDIGFTLQAEPGEHLFQEGDPQDYLYVLLRGRVAIELHVPARGRLRLATVEPPEVFGWSSVTPVVRQRTASATVVLPSELAAFDADQLRMLMDQDHDLGYLVMRRMANVIAGRLLTTRLQWLDMFALPGQRGSG
ncbi:MAG: Crp/Fnr family transcriptional regulator [Anaerolineales bacterium]